MHAVVERVVTIGTRQLTSYRYRKGVGRFTHIPNLLTNRPGQCLLFSFQHILTDLSGQARVNVVILLK